MCGIYGFYQFKDVKPCQSLESIIERLALSNIQRGRDSTGQVIITADDKMHVIKKLGDAKHYYHHAEIKNGIQKHFRQLPKVILGHSRSATTGEITLGNAQPFIYENVIGTHNGIISNYLELFQKYGLRSVTSCDSEIIFALLSTTAKQETRASLLGELDGYLAIAYYDLNTVDEIHFASIYNECLFVYSTPYGVFWSSIKRSLKKALNKYRIPHKQVDIGTSELISISSKGQVTRSNIMVTTSWSYDALKSLRLSIPDTYACAYNDQHDEHYRICDNCYDTSFEPLNFRLVTGYGICKKCEALYWVDDKKPDVRHYEV